MSRCSSPPCQSRRLPSGLPRWDPPSSPAPPQASNPHVPAAPVPTFLPLAAYFGSLLATLYVSFVMHSYVFSLLFCVAQVRVPACWVVGGYLLLHALLHGRIYFANAPGAWAAPALPWLLCAPAARPLWCSPAARLTCWPWLLSACCQSTHPPPVSLSPSPGAHPGLLCGLLLPRRRSRRSGAHQLLCCWALTMRECMAASIMIDRRSAVTTARVFMSAAAVPIPCLCLPLILLPLQSVVSFAGRGALSLGSAAFRASFRT